MGNERFGLYGLIPKERDFNKSEDFEKQRAGEGDVLIYETDNTEEARAIYEAGGFERKGVWHAVTRVEDRAKGRPANVASSVSTHARPVPSKRDYDQA